MWVWWFLERPERAPSLSLLGRRRRTPRNSPAAQKSVVSVSTGLLTFFLCFAIWVYFWDDRDELVMCLLFTILDTTAMSFPLPYALRHSRIIMHDVHLG